MKKKIAKTVLVLQAFLALWAALAVATEAKFALGCTVFIAVLMWCAYQLKDDFVI